jgi:hypothetical protein
MMTSSTKALVGFGFAALAGALIGARLSDSETPPPKLTRLDPPAAPGSVGPNLATVNGDVILSWLEPAQPSGRVEAGAFALRNSRLVQGHWTKPESVVSGNRVFANWADFPSIAQAPAGWLVAHWAEMSGEGTYSYDVQLARSEWPGLPWRRIGAVHDDGTETEHGFVSFVSDVLALRAFWLDGRETKAVRGANSGHGDEGDMTLRTATVGTTSRNGELLDGRVCDCCQTSAAMTSEGPIVVYRDRSDKEIRDIAIVRRSSGRWTKPRLVSADGWKIEGCPVNGPSADARDKLVAVAWFTAAHERARVLAAFSADAGATFDPPVVVDATDPLGRVGLVLDGNGDALVSWVAGEGAKPSIRLRRVRRGGSMGAPIVITETSAARTSGFPRIKRSGNTLVLAWVDPQDPPRLRAGVLEASRVKITP